MTDDQFDTALRDLALGLIHERPSERLRIDRGLVLALNQSAYYPPGGPWKVQSATDPEVIYNLHPEGCDCPDKPRALEGRCKHYWCVYLTHAAMQAERTQLTEEPPHVAD